MSPDQAVLSSLSSQPRSAPSQAGVVLSPPGHFIFGSNRSLRSQDVTEEGSSELEKAHQRLKLKDLKTT